MSGRYEETLTPTLSQREREKVMPWMCCKVTEGAQHVLGQVSRNGRGVRQLLLYRQAVDLGAEDPGEVDVMAIVEGHVMDVRCSICGRVRTWVPGEEALRALIEGMKRI